MQSEDQDALSVASPSSEEPVVRAPVYHELFNSTDADVVLGSKDGVLFRVHTYTLKTTSGWFRDMFSLPQDERGTTDAVTVYLDEDATTLEALLRCVCGLAIPRLDSYDHIEPLLFAAEKYDMPGPPSIVRAMVTTPALLSEPLRLFVLACRYGWDDVIQLSSAHTLSLNLHDPKYAVSMAKLSSLSMYNLMQLHRGRRDALDARLNEPPFVNDGVDSACSHCGSTVDYHTWRELKSKIFKEMDIRALGDTVCEPGLTDWAQAQRCWLARCANCNRVLYDKKESVRAIRECIDQLPTTLSSLLGKSESRAASG